MNQIVLHPDASQEAVDAAEYYERVREGLGIDFRLELKTLLAKIKDNPALFPHITPRFRFSSLQRFPYLVIYEVIDDIVWVAAIAHHRQRPQYWIRRQP